MASSVFSNTEKTRMILALGAANMNYDEAVTKYGEMFPGTRVPNSRTIRRTFLRLSSTGSFNRAPESYRRRDTVRVRDSSQANRVRQAVAQEPRVSVRAISRRTGVSATTAWRILHQGGYHPYHVSLHQSFQPEDYNKRVDFCNWVLNTTEETPNFVDNVIWTDEAHFSRNSQVNLHNAHFWSRSNPHWVRACRHQFQWSFNVWAGIYNGKVIGPVFLDRNLTGDIYHDEILESVVSCFVDDLPIAQRLSLWYQHDGAPPHCVRRVVNSLHGLFGDKWIGRFGPVPWPARSPDLTPMDFYLWGRIKEEVYKDEPRSPHDLQEKITAFCRSLPRREVLKATRDVVRRAQLCIGVDGGHFEQL